MKVEVNDTEVQVMLGNVLKRVSDMRPAMRDISILLKESVKKNFEAEGRPKKWKPLAPSTIASKVKRKGTWRPILVDTGKLRASNTPSYGAKWAKLTNAVKGNYGWKHQYGTGKIPARPFMMIQDEDIPRIIDVLRRYIEND